MGRGAGDHQEAPGAQRNASPRRNARTAYRWSDAALEAELRKVTEGKDVFPTYADLDAVNRSDLRSAIAEHGGVQFWAARLGLALPPARRRLPYDEATALRHAIMAIEETGDGMLPGERKLRLMGYGQLATRVRQAGGAAKFAARYGLGGANDRHDHPEP